MVGPWGVEKGFEQFTYIKELVGGRKDSPAVSVIIARGFYPFQV